MQFENEKFNKMMSKGSGHFSGSDKGKVKKVNVDLDLSVEKKEVVEKKKKIKVKSKDVKVIMEDFLMERKQAEEELRKHGADLYTCVKALVNVNEDL